MRLLILGTGGMANQHAKNFSAIDGVSVVGGVDVVPERLAAFCAEHKIGKAVLVASKTRSPGANSTPSPTSRRTRVHHPTTHAGDRRRQARLLRKAAGDRRRPRPWR